MNRFVFVVLIFVFFFASCTFYLPKLPFTPSEALPADADYLAKTLATPLAFSVPNAKAEEAWSRINVFISKYSVMKIHIATNSNIETYYPQDTIQYGYSASRLQKGEETEFTVNCFSGGSFGGANNIANQNAHILAYYALTGEIVTRLIA